MRLRRVILAILATGSVVAHASVARAQTTVPNAATATNTTAAAAAGAGASAAGSGLRGPVRREVPPKPRRIVKTPAEPGTDAATVEMRLAETVAAAGKPAPKAGSAPPTGAVSEAVLRPGYGVGANAWSPQEIAEAKAHCDVVLKGVDAVTWSEEPIKHGQCGAPAVVKLVSIGKSPAVELNPPAVVTCDMVVALHKWFKADVQRLARVHLGGSIVKIETMSSYSCRNAYGRARTNLSEHGRANALDIGGFVTASADTTRVLASWGMTGRALKTMAAKAEAAKAEAERAAAAATGLPKAPGPSVATTKPSTTTAPVVVGAGTAARSPVITGSTSASGGGLGGGITTPPSLPGVIVRIPGQDLGGAGAFGLVAPNRLGGAKSTTQEAPPARPEVEARRKQFLHEVHEAACKHFGTVLGPEANNDHNNHFHVDMAPRKTRNFCE